MEINTTKKLANPQFYGREYPKKQIFLHHTAGTTADGAITWWNQTPEAVGTPFVIDRDGTIYQVFSPNCWAYHLGVKTSQGGDPNELDEKQSIGIEIVSAGPIYQEADKFVQYPLYPNKLAKNAIKPEDVWDMGEDKAGWWKGHRFYQSYTDKQIDSVIWLVKKLMVDFKITLQSDILKMFAFDKEIIKTKPMGLYSHSTVREDKSDIIPHKILIEKLKEAFPDNVGVVKSTKK